MSGESVSARKSISHLRICEISQISRNEANSAARCPKLISLCVDRTLCENLRSLGNGTLYVTTRLSQRFSINVYLNPLGTTNRDSTMRLHYETFVTEEDFAMIAGAGL